MIECLPLKHPSLSVIAGAHVQSWAWRCLTAIPLLGVGGAETHESLGLLTSQFTFSESPEPSERLCLKKQSGLVLRNDTCS